jgi:hypothetical protein
MVFVPMMGQPQLPSPRAQELGQRVAMTIAEFQQKYPDLSAEEIRQAMEVAASRAPDHGRPAAAGIADVVAGLAVAAGLGVFLLGNRVSLPHGGGALPAIAVAVGAALVAFLVRRSRE